MAKPNYGKNDYEQFVKGAQDPHSLHELLCRVECQGKEGTRWEDQIDTGPINEQYAIVKNESSTYVLDIANNTKVAITGKGAEHFIKAVRSELEELCDGDYEEWAHLEGLKEEND